MINDTPISMIIPCYNEEDGLKNVFDVIPRFNGEVIVVDNGCEDNSMQVAKRYNARILTEKTRGYGRALQKGLDHAGGELIAIIDGDGSYPVEVFEEMYLYMKKGDFDLVSGCRFPLKDSKAMPRIKTFGNYCITWLVRSLFKIDIIDSMSGMMLFKKSILGAIKAHTNGMGFTQEMNINAWLNTGIKCGEFHIPYYPRIGKVKFKKIKDSIGVLYNVLSLRAGLRKRY